MRSYKDAKAMAKSLRDVLAARNVPLSHSECLEIVAQQFGVSDWNTLSSKLTAEEHQRPLARDAEASLPSKSTSPDAPVQSLTTLPLVPLRDVVVYPGMRIPIFTGRPKTIHAIEVAMRGDRRVLLVTQRQFEVNEPSAEHLHPIGTVAIVQDMAAGPTGMASGPPLSWKVLVEGIARAHLDMLHAEDHLWAEIRVLSDIQTGDTPDVRRKAMLTRFEQQVRLREWLHKPWKTPPEPTILENIRQWLSSLEVGRFADTLAAYLPLPLAEKQAVLEILDVDKRLEYVDVATKKLEQPPAL